MVVTDIILLFLGKASGLPFPIPLAPYLQISSNHHKRLWQMFEFCALIEDCSPSNLYISVAQKILCSFEKFSLVGFEKLENPSSIRKFWIFDSTAVAYQTFSSIPLTQPKVIDQCTKPSSLNWVF